MLRIPVAVPGILFLLVVAPVLQARPPRVVELRTQEVGALTYFHVRLTLSPGFELPDIDLTPEQLPPEGLRRRLARLPRLVPLDGKTRSVCYRLPPPVLRWKHTPGRPSFPEFVGLLQGKETARFLLRTPVEKEAVEQDESLVPSLQEQGWQETPLTLDFPRANEVGAFTGKRGRDEGLSPRDLEGLWAEAQAGQFAVLEAQTPDFGFYGFAREAVGRKYKVPARPLKTGGAPPQEEGLRLYEMTTGTTALAESLARRRVLSVSSGRTRRVIDINKVEGITIAEHPWEKMMAGKKPTHEPLAELVPHDNYYVAFKSLRKFIEFGALTEQWGANLIQAYEVQSRDFGLKRRYEKQLCLRHTALGKSLGPLVIRGIAVTGSDPYLREGSDISVIFHVKHRGLFLAAVESFVEEARKEFGQQLKHEKEKYRGVNVESFCTSLREVSLHRAAFGDYVVYANSPVGLRRILDTHAGQRKALAEALDFRYMRTIFRSDDKSEDGFVFFSDAFIRQLVGPASKIKEKRRLEALASLHLLTSGALFAGWETGKLPTDHASLLSAARLLPGQLEVPEGKAAHWDAARRLAVADVYGTLQFATPLIELPIDKISRTEDIEYHGFREIYLGNWRRYFDPVGMRLALKGEEVRLEVYILPLVANSEYNSLRLLTGGGTTRFTPASLSPRAMFQYTIHLDPALSGRYLDGALDDWLLLRLEDGAAYRRWAEFLVRRELGDVAANRLWDESQRLICQTPVVVGVGIGKPRVFDDLIEGNSPPDVFSKRLKAAYKGVTVTSLHSDPKGAFADLVNGLDTPVAKRIVPVIHHAKVDGGWYASFSLDALHDVIDRAVARRQAKKPAKDEGVPINSSVYVSPKAAVQAAGALNRYLEWESHRRALANAPLWYTLYRAGLIDKDVDSKTAEAAARKFFGFVPISPDGAAYRYESRTDEVANVRHGTLSRPRLHAGLDPKAPLAQLLGQLRTLRADLRFREDGIHTTLTIRRKLPEK